MTLNDQHFVQVSPIAIEELCPHCLSSDCSCDLPEYAGAFQAVEQCNDPILQMRIER